MRNVIVAIIIGFYLSPILDIISVNKLSKKKLIKKGVNKSCKKS